GERGRIPPKGGVLRYGVAARTQRNQRPGLGSREGRRARSGSGHADHPAFGGGAAPVVIDNVLDHSERAGRRLLIVVCDRADLGLASGDGAGAVGGQTLRVTAGTTALVDAVAAGVEGDERPGLATGECRRIRRLAGHRDRPVVGGSRTTVVV